MSYVMESKGETARLIAQESVEATDGPLDAVGISRGQAVLDAGCGPGVVTRKLCERVGPTGKVTGIDLSAERLAAARKRCAAFPYAEFAERSVLDTGLPDASVDAVWCQFVLEYLPDRKAALREFARVVRPGGKVIVSEIDGLGLNNWPMPPEVEQGCQKLVAALAPTGFDLFAGRKLFSELRELGFEAVKVHVFPQYVVAGAADARTLDDWRVRFEALAPLAAPGFGGLAEYRKFADAFLAMFADDRSLNYSVQLVTEGIRR